MVLNNGKPNLFIIIHRLNELKSKQLGQNFSIRIQYMGRRENFSIKLVVRGLENLSVFTIKMFTNCILCSFTLYLTWIENRTHIYQDISSRNSFSTQFGIYVDCLSSWIEVRRVWGYWSLGVREWKLGLSTYLLLQPMTPW